MPDPRPAWYAPSGGAGGGTGGGPGRGWWRDWATILHPPYTAWHMSYVLIGATMAPHFRLGRLVATLLAFALAVGLGAHGLDELRGRPLRTAIPARSLAAVSVAAICGAVALGALGISEVGWGLTVFIIAGVVLVVGYNLELWHGLLHNSTTFALGWGSFPLLTAYFTQASTLRVGVVAAAGAAFWLSRAQRLLSTEARDLRRRVVSVQGQRVYGDGRQTAITREALLGPVERALVALSWSTCLLGAGLVLARTGY